MHLVHDSILAEVPEDEVDHCEKLLHFVQLDRGLIIPGAPVGCDFEIDEDYSMGKFVLKCMELFSKYLYRVDLDLTGLCNRCYAVHEHKSYPNVNEHMSMETLDIVQRRAMGFAKFTPVIELQDLKEQYDTSRV